MKYVTAIHLHSESGDHYLLQMVTDSEPTKEEVADFLEVSLGDEFEYCYIQNQITATV